MKEPLKYVLEVEVEKIHSPLITVIALLEEIMKRYPEIYPIAVQAVEQYRWNITQTGQLMQKEK